MTWGPDLRGQREPTRPDVVVRYDDERRAAAYFASAGPVPVGDQDQARPDVINPRRDDKRRARAYTADLEDEL